MARGDAHEGMNFAGVRKLPVVFICDNNQWAYSTPTHLEYAVDHLADRAQAYGFEGVVVDGTDVLAVYREAKRAIEKARNGGGPTLIECQTLRMEGHAVHDDAFYVPKELFERWAERDPIERYRTWLREQADMADEEEDEIAAYVKKLLNDSLSARSSRRSPTRRRCSRASTRRPRTSTRPTTSNGREDVSAGDQRRPARQEMRRDKRVFVLGEDVGVYGGAFKVTLGFQEEFGAWRVIDTPLSETAIVGGRDRRGDHGHAPRRRDAVRRLRLVRAGTTSSRSRRSSAGAPAHPCRSCCGCPPAAASPAARSTRRTPSRRSRTSPA